MLVHQTCTVGGLGGPEGVQEPAVVLQEAGVVPVVVVVEDEHLPAGVGDDQGLGNCDEEGEGARRRGGLAQGLGGWARRRGGGRGSTQQWEGVGVGLP